MRGHVMATVQFGFAGRNAGGEAARAHGSITKTTAKTTTKTV